MVSELKTCQNDTLEGSAATHSVTSAPTVGDASIGVRTEVDEATALSNYALVGPTMVYAGTVAYVSGDADEAAELLVKQVGAYKAGPPRPSTWSARFWSDGYGGRCATQQWQWWPAVASRTTPPRCPSG